MMKKKFTAILFLIFVLSLTGCKRPNLAVFSEEKKAEIIAERASKNMFGASSGFEIAEGEKLYVEPALKKGEISLMIKKVELGSDAAIEELTDAVSGTNADLEIRVSGSVPLDYELEPGSYSIYATVISKADGKIELNIR